MEKWPSRIIFIFAAVGSAAGLGNLWRFPYLTYKYGGGAFLVPYFLALLVLGLPLLILEFGLGKEFRGSAVKALDSIKKGFGVAGWWALGIGFIILSYYAVIMAWVIRYFVGSFRVAWRVSPQEYFNNALKISSGVGELGGVNWALIGCLILVWVMIYFSVWKGVKSISKVITVLMPLPFVLLSVLLVRVLSLKGSLAGIMYYIRPEFSALLDPEVWLAASSQIFFTLTLGFGVMIAYASYSHDKDNTISSAVWTAMLNSLISIIAGFVIFGTLGFLATTNGMGVEEVVASGPGLAFIVFPKALSMMPWPAFFSILFFLTLLSLGIDSAFSLIEGLSLAIREKTGLSTQKTTLWASAASFIIGILFVTGAGIYYLDIVDHYTANYGLIVIGLIESLMVGWSFAGKKISKSFGKFGGPWLVIIRWVAPVILSAMLITTIYKEIITPYGNYPLWADAIGWLALVLPLITAIILGLTGRRSEVSES